MRWSTRAVATIAGRPGGGGRDVVCTAAAGSMLGMPAAACGARCSLGVGALGETGRRDTSSPQLVFIEITHRASERALCIGETADALNVAIDPCICILVPRQTFINTVF